MTVFFFSGPREKHAQSMLKALFHTFLAFPIWEKVITRGNEPVTAAYSPIKVWSEAQLKEKRSQDHFEKKIRSDQGFFYF